MINSKTEMKAFARKVAQEAKIGDVFALKGTLGAGKSFFAKHFINALMEKETEILSPTFNLVYDYDGKLGKIYHFDLYRLKNPEELENIGFFEALENGITLIEWPEIAANYLPKNHQQIEINFVKDGPEESREVLVGAGPCARPKTIPPL